jgi:hypothetical protein
MKIEEKKKKTKELVGTKPNNYLLHTLPCFSRQMKATPN